MTQTDIWSKGHFFVNTGDFWKSHWCDRSEVMLAFGLKMS
jgi:hypothetical protein